MDLKERYLNPLTDFGFKKLFGTEPNKELLIDFLNQILPEEHTIQDLAYTVNEQLGISEPDRKAIFDLYCTSLNGDKFIVELQKARQNYFKDRSVFYSTFPIREQARKGPWNFKLSAVYTVGILDFVFTEHKNDTNFLHLVQLKDQDCNVFYDKLSYIYMELPKFTKTVDELETRFEKWLYVLRHLPNLQDRPARLQERIFHKLFEAAELAKFSPEEQHVYEASLKYYRDINNVVETSWEEGFVKGEAKGFAEGEASGEEKGILKTAKNLKDAGVSIELIIQATGLSRAQIEQL